MPIVVDHGPNGLALQAAVAAGTGQRQDRGFAQDQQLVQQARQFQLAQQEQQFNLERLRAASAAQRRLTQSPIPADARIVRGSPLVNTVAQRTPRARQTTTSPAERTRDQVEGTGRLIGSLGTFTVQPGGNIVRSDAPEGDTRTLQQLQQSGQTGGFVTFSGTDSDVSPITEVLESALDDPNLTDFGRQELEALRELFEVEEGGLTPNQQVDTIRDIQRRNQIADPVDVDRPSATSIFNAELRTIDDEIGQLTSQINALEKQQREDGFTTVQSAFNTQASQRARTGSAAQRRKAEIAILRNSEIQLLRQQRDELNAERRTRTRDRETENTDGSTTPAPTTETPQIKAQRLGLPLVDTQDELNTLPSGAEFIDAQTGERGRKR